MKKIITVEMDFVHDPDEKQITEALRGLLNGVDMLDMFRTHGMTGIQYIVDDVDE